LGETIERNPCIKIETDDGLKAGVKRAAEVIMSGGMVAFPTESFYGLAVNGTDEEAIRRLFVVKKRQSDSPILILIPTVGVLDQFAVHIPEVARRLIEEFWPGGLTIVFEARPNLPSLLTAGTGRIGVRLSSHPVAAALAKAAGVPITGTSANISGRPPCKSAIEVFRSLGEGVDLILDGGETEGAMGSTILDATMNPPRILREGIVDREQLQQVLGKGFDVQSS
jgi:L-threonylcarbamoyladenylate synthase